MRSEHRCRSCNRFYRASTGKPLPVNPCGKYSVIEGVCVDCWQPRLECETDNREAKKRLASALFNCAAIKMAAELRAMKMTMGRSV